MSRDHVIAIMTAVLLVKSPSPNKDYLEKAIADAEMIWQRILETQPGHSFQ